MEKSNEPMLVRYKYNKEHGDLVCEVTEFMDEYLLGLKYGNPMFCTYLYNDLAVFSNEDLLRIAFRVPRCYKR